MNLQNDHVPGGWIDMQIHASKRFRIGVRLDYRRAVDPMSNRLMGMTRHENIDEVGLQVPGNLENFTILARRQVIGIFESLTTAAPMHRRDDHDCPLFPQLLRFRTKRVCKGRHPQVLYIRGYGASKQGFGTGPDDSHFNTGDLRHDRGIDTRP
ncbi:MAG: hypothetical protein BWY17_05362 [Deltaproteobacteria bacterium ADurb.Bin207]|nr:MAG: hypothetical protein BWY17_05362 [Deltaproteobacteria bacterium ADurb.Bin207]